MRPLRRLCLLVPLGLAALALPGFAGTSWNYDAAGRQYVITHTATSPATPAGTEIVLTATATWYDEEKDVVVEAVSEPVTLTVAPTTWTLEYVYNLPPQLEAILDSASGVGGIERLPDGNIRAFLPVDNDGREHRLSWRMRLKR